MTRSRRLLLSDRAPERVELLTGSPEDADNLHTYRPE